MSFSDYSSICDPYSKQACSEWAERKGFTRGGYFQEGQWKTNWDTLTSEYKLVDKYYQFFGDYDTKGCYYYDSWKSSVFYGLGGSVKDMDKPPTKDEGKFYKSRPEDNICNCKHNQKT